MNLSSLIIGILISFLSIIYLIYTIKSAKKDKDYDSMTSSFDVSIVSGTLVFLLLGIVMIYRELKHLF